MDWISVGIRKPEKDVLCFVINNKYGSQMYDFYPLLALYDNTYDVFTLYDLSYRHNSHSVCVDVTHWMEVPSLSEDEY